MSGTTATRRPPRPDLEAVTNDDLIAYRDAENRFRASVAARAVIGHPDPGAGMTWQDLIVADREIAVRAYRPASGPTTDLPLIVHVHGGGFVGTAAQCDWANSYLAARLPAVIVSVEHRLLDFATPLPAAADDVWDTLVHVLAEAPRWGVDPARTAVFGESFGGLIAALAAIRARAAGTALRAQVLVNPAVDVTDTMLDHASAAEHADTPMLDIGQLRFLRKLAVPTGADARAVSPLHADDLGGLAPALVVVPTHDPLADHGRRYAEALQAAGSQARVIEYPAAPHAFLTTPGVTPQAEQARTDIAEFLRAALAR